MPASVFPFDAATFGLITLGPFSESSLAAYLELE